MVTFALITEGITDQAFLEHVIYEYYETVFDIDVDVNPLQPARDQTDIARSASYGGWEAVFEYCELPNKIENALTTSDYIVIQIDTDCGHEVNFDVPLTELGEDRDFISVIEDVKSKLIEKLEGQYDGNEDKIIFAISHQSLECWIISFYGPRPRQRVKNCANHLSRVMAKQDERFEKTYDCYKKLSRSLKGNDLIALAELDCSFGHFISSLPSIETE